jgi:cytochrome c553
MAQRVLACTTCHRPQGRAGPDGYYPRLAGKPAHYLYKQLLDFRDGRRHYPLMAGLLAPLSDDYLFDIAKHFSALDLPYAPATATVPAATPGASGATTVAQQRGQQLATVGDPARKLPACSACHGAALTGVLPQVPGLLGLSRDYLNAQLGGWQSGQRLGHAPDCMANVSKRLSLPDIAAVSAWLSAQPLPVNTRPAPASAAIAADVSGLQCAKVSAPPEPGSQTARAAGTAETTRGAYLARAGNCMACHTAPGGAPYTGGRAIDTPFGKVFAGNLTPDRQTGLGGWSRDDFWQALHEGRSKSGRLLYPAFPYPNFTAISRDDADALFAYLQTLPAQAAAQVPHQLRWPYNSQLALRVWRAVYFKPGQWVANPAKSEPWNRGAYLVQGLGHCSACHTPRNALGASQSSTGLTGGLIPMQNWYAPALNAAHEAGVGTWSLADIKALLSSGRTPDAHVSGPMAEVVRGSTQYLNDADLHAMATYLKDLPLAASKPAPPEPAPPAMAVSAGPERGARGAKLYEQHCAQCHGDQGLGVRAAYPALAGNRAVTLHTPVNLVQTVLYGGFAPATPGNRQPFGMPPYVLTLTDADLAAVLTHIRGSWGNRASAVTELQISQIRQ